MHPPLWVFPIVFWIGAVAWRVRGSGIIASHAEARYIIWGIPVGLIVLLATQIPILGFLSTAAAGFGASFGYWGDFDIRWPQNRTFSNYLKLTTMGALRFTPLFILGCIMGFGLWVLPAVFAGTAFVPSYLFGWKLSPHLSLPLLTSFSEWGEFFFGGILLFALSLGLLA